MINPHLLEATYLKLERPGPRFAAGAKLYRPAFGTKGRFKGCRHAFRTATRARQHAQRVLERWCAKYDTAIAAGDGERDVGFRGVGAVAGRAKEC